MINIKPHLHSFHVSIFDIFKQMHSPTILPKHSKIERKIKAINNSKFFQAVFVIALLWGIRSLSQSPNQPWQALSMIVGALLHVSRAVKSMESAISRALLDVHESSWLLEVILGRWKSRSTIDEAGLRNAEERHVGHAAKCH
jgi:hypothetical protein